MKLPGFLGGSDVQRSSNHAANRCVNLYSTPNDDGTVGALVTTPGLTLEVTNPSSAISLGIYTASNGRAFEVVGTTLYELTSSGGVISTTSRGTVTAATTYKFSDNGIDMLAVNGTDGWLFKLATNALKKITVKQSDFTVTLASPAVFSSASHGLVAGDIIRMDVNGDGFFAQSTFAAVCATPNDIVLSYDGASAYAVNFDSPTISQYSRNTTTGALTALGTPTVATGTSPFELAITSDSTSVYVTNIGAATVSMFSRNVSTGALTALGTPTIATGTGPNGIVCSPSGTHVYVANQGSDTVSQYSRNIATGALTALGTPTIATGAGPTNIAMSGDGLNVYVTNATGNTVFQFTRSATTGQLSYLATIACGNNPSAIVVSADDAFIYVVNRNASTVSQYIRNSSTGAMTFLSTVATGTSPEDIVINDGFAYVSSISSSKITMYSRDERSGLLTSAGIIATTSSPYRIALDSTKTFLYISCYATSAIYKWVVSDYTNGALPIGLANLTDYYVIATGLTANAFEVSATLGGTAINTTGTQNGILRYTSIGWGFPNGCVSVDYIDGRFVACELGTQNFYCSDVLDAPRWDALNVQTADSNPDYVVTQVVIRNELVIFCENSLEIYYDSGTYPSPFTRNLSAIAAVGCAAAHSVVKLDNTAFWLGRNELGQGVVYRLNGYTPLRVSTYSVEYAIQAMSTISDAVAFGYQQDGHHFYCITFPTGNKTFALDLNTNLWHERAAFAAGAFSRWEATHYTYAFGKHLVTDNAEGKIYSLSLGVYADGTATHKWLRSWQCPDTGMKRERHSKLEIHMEKGVGVTGGASPTLMLKWSDDGGHTWSSEVWQSAGIGDVGEYTKRVVFHRLGATNGMPRIYELSGTAAVKTVLLAAYLN